MDYLLEVEQVYAGYVQDLYILQGVNFRIAPRELVTVIESQWCGKIYPR
jgi:neutral amino acid transport system ATP-binding protein